jgi:Fic family protein
MPFKADKPYNQLPDLPPEQEVETRAVLKKCIAARAALAELRQATDLIPDAGMLVNTLPLLEAQASSEIENIVTTTDSLFEFAGLGEDRADPATKEALRYRTALREGVDYLQRRPLGTRLAEQLCSRIKGVEMTVRKVPGTALASRQTGNVVYTPPQGEALLREKLANWETYLHQQQEIDVLVRMAVAHYQFEAIHPFTDGNGRTGRLLNMLFLVEQGLLTLPILYLSRYIIEHRDAYYDSLLRVTSESAWQEWILFVLNGVEQTAVWTRDKIAAIRGLLEHTNQYVRQQKPEIQSRELIDVIFTQPYCRIANLVDAGIAKRQTASVYLKQLVDLGVLTETKVGREKLFIHPKLIRVITGSNEFSRYPKGRLATAYPDRTSGFFVMYQIWYTSGAWPVAMRLARQRLETL